MRDIVQTCIYMLSRAENEHLKTLITILFVVVETAFIVPYEMSRTERSSVLVTRI